MSRKLAILPLLFLCGCASAVTMNVGALTAVTVTIGGGNTNVIVESGLFPAVTNFIAATTMGSTNVSIKNIGTNVIHAGQAVELFGVGTNHGTCDLLCQIQSVSAGTNFTIIYPSGLTSTNVHCVIGYNNMTQLRADEELAESFTPPKSIFLSQSGDFLAFDETLYDQSHIFANEYSALPGVTVANGVTWIGTNGNSILCTGAFMIYPVASIGGGAGGFLKFGSTLFWEVQTATPQNQLVFSNMTLDGGLLGASGSGTAITSHDAFFQYWDGSGSGQFAYNRTFSGCTFRHWSGEVAKSTVTTGGTGTSYTTTNCNWLDCNFTGVNFTFGGTNVADTFDTVGQISEHYQAYATCPTLWSNITMTNIVGNWFAENGSLAASSPQPVTYTGIRGAVAHNVYVWIGTPAANVTWTNCDIRSQDPANPGYGILSTAAGLQPVTGASDITNIVIVGNNFHDLFWPISFDGYTAYNWKVSNNVSSSTHGFAVVGGAGYKRQIYFYSNSCPSSVDSTLVDSGGQYFYDDQSNAHGSHEVPSGGGDSVSISYGTGWYQKLIPSVGGKTFYMSFTDSNTIPVGLHGEIPIVVLSNASGFDTTYAYSNLSATVVLHPGDTAKSCFTNGYQWVPSL